jgi:4'-phosphopantetheinyl transferase EntD
MVSLTHKAQTIMAVIAPAANFHGLGIDLEYRPPQRNIDRAKDRMIDLIGNLEESSVIKQELAQLRQEPGVLISPAADTDPFLVLFSIKEASYKALRGEATTLKKIALTSFSPHAISGLTLPCFRSTLRYDGQDIEAVTLALRCFQISIAWF